MEIKTRIKLGRSGYGNRRVLLALSFALGFVLISGLAAAQNSATSFANVSVTPNPVIAGGNVTVRFQLYNSQNFYLFDVNLQPTGGYPLFNFSPLSSYHAGIMNAGLNNEYFNYTFHIPNYTQSGTYTINFVATYSVLGSTGGEVGTSTMPLSFYVQNRPVIKTSFASTATALYSGSNQTLTLDVENTGYGVARNISVVLKAGNGISLQSPVTKFFIANLSQNKTATEQILVAAKNASTANITANVTYYSSNFNNKFSSSQNLSLSVAPSAKFTVVSESSSVMPGSTDMPVVFTILNSGNSEADGVSLSLQTTYPITPVAGTYYISKLLPGESANVTFLVSADSAGIPGNYPVTIYEQWKQPNAAVNQLFESSSNYQTAVVNYGGNETLEEIAILVILALIAVFVAKKRNMLHKKK